jgi:hypothetical protein
MQLHVIAATFRAKMEKKELSVCQGAVGRTGRRTGGFGGGAGRRHGGSTARVSAGRKFHELGGGLAGAVVVLMGPRKEMTSMSASVTFFNFYICPYMWVPLVRFFFENWSGIFWRGCNCKKTYSIYLMCPTCARFLSKTRHQTIL